MTETRAIAEYLDELLGTSNIKQGMGAIGYLTGGLIPREAAFFERVRSYVAR